MKKIIVSLVLVILFSGNLLAAGSSGDGESKTKSNYDQNLLLKENYLDKIKNIFLFKNKYYLYAILVLFAAAVIALLL